jgi:hypothetical protein
MHTLLRIPHRSHMLYHHHLALLLRNRNRIRACTTVTGHPNLSRRKHTHVLLVFVELSGFISQRAVSPWSRPTSPHVGTPLRLKAGARFSRGPRAPQTAARRLSVRSPPRARPETSNAASTTHVSYGSCIPASLASEQAGRTALRTLRSRARCDAGVVSPHGRPPISISGRWWRRRPTGALAFVGGLSACSAAPVRVHRSRAFRDSSAAHRGMRADPRCVGGGTGWPPDAASRAEARFHSGPPPAPGPPRAGLIPTFTPIGVLALPTSTSASKL